MQINVLLPTGTQTVNLDELKELVRQGVVQPSTLLETGGQRGKAKNVPALKPIFAELAAAQTQTPEPPNLPSIPTPPEPPVFSSFPTPPEPPVFEPSQTPQTPSLPSTQDEPQPLVFPQIATPEPPETPSFPEVSANDATPQSPPISPEINSFAPENAIVFPRVAPSSSGKSLKAIRAAKLEYWVKWGRGFLAVFDVAFVIGALVYFVGNVFPAIVEVFKAIGEPFYKETLYLCGGLILLFLLAAFGYGLATILFRILFAATALYAASCEEEARNAR